MVEKKWFQSKTKTGAVLVGVAAVLGTVGGWMTGVISTPNAIQTLITEVGMVWFAFGLRNLPFVNRAK